MSIRDIIHEQVTSHPVTLYMKGSYDFPQCGFSGQVVSILGKLGVKPFCVNVLEHPEIRQGIKEYSNWPTLPQLYIQGEFIGGCDIVTELYESGELAELLKIPE